MQIGSRSDNLNPKLLNSITFHRFRPKGMRGGRLVSNRPQTDEIRPLFGCKGFKLSMTRSFLSRYLLFRHYSLSSSGKNSQSGSFQKKNAKISLL